MPGAGGGVSLDTLTHLCEQFCKSKNSRGGGTAILTRDGIDPATRSKLAFARRSCAGRIRIKNISIAKYLNRNLVRLFPVIFSDAMMLRSSPRCRPPAGPTQVYRQDDCTEQLQRPRMADRTAQSPCLRTPCLVSQIGRVAVTTKIYALSQNGYGARCREPHVTSTFLLPT
jgi:hypothetical protein